ncbi:unnamed protein product [Aureobasidium vineae]|uniref:Signal transduction histidine kinase dimerisation/phosphoacceptor domain-containing protein n=1 Tax=Aureobasidium vineae TaxID=2773715 RepID=A0A9N8JE11_9PEZI|nr:unnamed protein product [Aureobasidium vineae]
MTAPGAGHDASIDTLIDLVTYDDRPTLLLDTSTRRIRFCNIAFDSLLQGTGASTDFQPWANSLCAVAAHATHEPIDLGTFAHQKWLGKSFGSNIMTVFCRWTASPAPAPALSAEDAVMLDHDQQRDENNDPSEETKLRDMYMGWLEPKDDPWMSFIRNYPFQDTALGPMSAWHPQLRRAVQRMMVCPETRILYWGDQHAMLYNEAAVAILGQKHPCLGTSLVDTWGQPMFDQIDATIRAVVVSGKAHQMKNVMFEMHRHGFSEQTWHHFYQLPIIGPDGRYLGCVCEFAENTTAVMQENRAAILDASIRIAASATDLKQLWPLALKPLAKTSIDIVAGCIFSVAGPADNAQSIESSPISPDYVLEASFGGTNAQSTSSLLKILNNASDYEKLLVLRRDDDTLPSDLQWSTADHGNITVVCILPITDLHNRKLAVAIFGMNPGRPFDEGSVSFVSRIGDLTRKGAIFVTLPAEQKRTAAITSALSDRLQIALLEAEIKEDSYARMARQAPIGMYMLRPDGYPVFVNDAYLALHGVSRTQFYKNADEGLGWNATLLEEDVPLATSMWISTISGTKPVQAEVRVKAPKFPDGIRWVESMSFAERDEAGNVTSVQGWLLDVSPRKMNERLINEKLQDALETKRATETFLDMLSHEMRNPLSSILQLADGIISLLETPPTPDTVEPLKDSAQTITLCARHMKTIIGRD